MHGRTLSSGLAILALGAAIVTGSTTDAAAAPPGRSADEKRLLSAINAARRARKMPALRHSRILSKPARAHSKRLVRSGELSHEGPNGEPFWKRLVRAGYSRRNWMGENLALISGCDWTPTEVVRMWLDSPPHRRNMLSKRFRVVGVGVAETPDCDLAVFTTDFGSR